MNMREKGITLVSLAITIIIMVILAGVTVYEGIDIINDAKLQTINTNMLLIQAKTRQIAEQAKFNNDYSNYKGQKLSEVTRK